MAYDPNAEYAKEPGSTCGHVIRFIQVPSLCLTYPRCCGVKEISGLRDSMASYGAERIVNVLAKMVAGHYLKCAFIMFSSINDATYGTDFKNYLESHKLGAVMQIKQTVNHNSGNRLNLFLWTMDHEEMKRRGDVLIEAAETPKVNIDILSSVATSNSPF